MRTTVTTTLLVLAIAALSTPLDAGARDCPRYDAGTKLGRVQDPTITEISGVVESRRAPGVLWVHNDSGDDPRFYALDTTGALLATVTLVDGKHRDWEDLAFGPGPVEGQDYLYLGDIGDNKGKRDSIRVFRVAEPKIDPAAEAPAALEVEGFDTLKMTYPDGHHNAETLLVDPVDGILYVVTKTELGPASLYRYPPPLRPGEKVELEFVTRVAGTAENQLYQTTPTGGDIAPDGSRVALRMYHRVWVWPRAAGQSLAEVLATEPCEASQREERQGEAVGFRAEGDAYLTISEGFEPAIWHFAPAVAE